MNFPSFIAKLTKLLEAELGTTGSDGSDDPAHIVADEAEPHRPRLLLHGPPQRGLGVGGHGIRLVEDDELVRRAGTAAMGRKPWVVEIKTNASMSHILMSDTSSCAASTGRSG